MFSLTENPFGWLVPVIGGGIALFIIYCCALELHRRGYCSRCCYGRCCGHDDQQLIPETRGVIERQELENQFPDSMI